VVAPSILRARTAAVVIALAALSGQDAAAVPGPVVITGPYASLLAASADLGASRDDQIRLTAALRRPARPEALIDWTSRRGLSVRWLPGHTWAILEGAPAAVENALGVQVHDYRGRLGQVFFASPQQPVVPARLRGEVAGMGRILGYTPHREALPDIRPLDLPPVGQRPDTLLPNVYSAQELKKAGYTGQGQTVVVFAFDGFDQSDLDAFADGFGLPGFTPQVVGENPSHRSGEATMDLELIHSLAPDAKKVLVNARPTVAGDGSSYERIAQMMQAADRDFPGAVWSLSIGWGCDKLVTAADLEPVRSAVAAAQKHGTTVFNAAGDLAGRECKGNRDWSAPPGPDDIGLDAVASIPEMTNVGGTTLSADDDGRWISEQAWFDVPLSQGTGGGVSNLFDRPAWQEGLELAEGKGKRLTPDVAAVADPDNGVEIVFGGQWMAGGGTSMSAPIWAGLAAVMNQYLISNSGRQLGELNPALYEIARGSRLPVFRSIELGGNSVHLARPGYDLVSGLGSPRVDNLVRELLNRQRQRPWG
jgi:kumamolisin